MGFNYGLEKKNFDRQWAIMRKQYEDAGMSIPMLILPRCAITSGSHKFRAENIRWA